MVTSQDGATRLDGLHRGALEVRSDRENWKAIRQDVLVHGLSQRVACEKYQLGWHTLKKILAHAEPPGYRQRQSRPKRVLAPVLPIIHEILEAKLNFLQSASTSEVRTLTREEVVAQLTAMCDVFDVDGSPPAPDQIIRLRRVLELVTGGRIDLEQRGETHPSMRRVSRSCRSSSVQPHAG